MAERIPGCIARFTTDDDGRQHYQSGSLGFAWVFGTFMSLEFYAHLITISFSGLFSGNSFARDHSKADIYPTAVVARWVAKALLICPG